jgi:dipeptidyl aminopeptidase/acylaminoacyl peptidase
MPTTRFDLHDLFLHRQVTQLDGTRAHAELVCALKSTEPAADGYSSSLWVLDSRGETAPLQLTPGTSTDSQPRWSPDGRRIAFLTDRAGGAPQLHLIARDGGEARLVCEFPRGVLELAWHPDGEHLLVVVPVAVDPDAHGEDRDTPPPERGPDAPEVVWRLPYKLDGLGYTLAERTHLFRVSVATGCQDRLTRGDFEVRGFEISPDGHHIAFSRTRDGAPHCTDIWTMPARGGEAQRLSVEQATATTPSWSPDGRCIVFAGAVDEGDAQSRLWRIDLPDGPVQALGDASIEVVPGGRFCWADDAGSFACVIARAGLQQVEHVTRHDGSRRPCIGGLRHVERLAAAGGRLAFTATSPDRAEEVYTADRDGANERVLSGFNAWWHDRRPPLVQWRKFTVPDGDGGEEQIDGWLMLPAHHRRGPLPLLVDVHGGPESYVLVDHHSHPHWPLLCEQGWAVLALNCVGSSSYGRTFSERLRGRWGELDLQQQGAAVQALQREGLADDRLAILGKSYGGYLSAFAIGRTGLFRAAVVMAPVGNLETHYGTSDSGYYADPYSMCGEPFIDRETSRKLSPMQYVQQTRTPTLFLQGKDDERCPKCQSEELYVTVARAGSTPAQMVLYPGGSHHFWESGRPSHRLDALRRVMAWLPRWIDRPLPRGAPADGMTVADGKDRHPDRQSPKEYVMAQEQNRNQGGQQDQQGGSQNQQGGGSRSGQQQQGGSQNNQQGGQQGNQANREQQRNEGNREQERNENREERR